MQNTTTYNRGDVVLVNFVFTAGTGVRRRPAVLLSSEPYQRGRQEVIVAGVTSNTERVLIGDVLIAEWHAAGLLYPSVVTGILRTIKQSMMVRKLGTLTLSDMDDVVAELRLSLGMVD